MKPLYLLLAASLLCTLTSCQTWQEVFPDKQNPPSLDLVTDGPYLSLYTSGVSLNQGRHRKSGVWSTPARRVTEMWAQRSGDSEMIRLDVYDFRRQLVSLFPDYPEVHGAILAQEFRYQDLKKEVDRLNAHLEKVITIRKEKQRIQSQPRPADPTLPVFPGESNK